MYLVKFLDNDVFQEELKGPEFKKRCLYKDVNLLVAEQGERRSISQTFWEDCERFVFILRPTFFALKVSDMNTPQLGHIYPMIQEAVLHMKTWDPEMYDCSYKVRLEINEEGGPAICSRKVFFRDSPVLEASYCVNPFYLDDPCDFYLRSRLKDAVKFIYGDTLYSGDVLKELSLYKSRSTRELQSPECLDDAKQLPALGWWKVWGYQFPHLQVVAKRLSAIHQGNGPAERDWSGRDFTKPKRRNRLSAIKHDKAHNVRVWLNVKAEKLAAVCQPRYGAVDFTKRERSGIAKLFPGPAKNDFVWHSNLQATAAKEFNDEFDYESECESDSSDDKHDVNVESEESESASDNESDWEEN